MVKYVHVSRNLKLCFFSSSGSLKWVTLRQAWLPGWLKLISAWPHTSTLPPGTLHGIFPLQLAPLPVSLLLCMLLLCHHLSSAPLAVFSWTICPVETWQCSALAAQQVPPALKYSQRFLWVIRFFYLWSPSNGSTKSLEFPFVKKN